MGVTRRTLIGTAAAGVVGARTGMGTRAQDATPAADGPGTPGVALARVRKLPSAALNEAIYPDVMATFLPPTAAVPGFLGYVFAFHQTDPTASLTLSLLSDETAAASAAEVAQRYVDQLDPRFVLETPVAVGGPMRVYEAAPVPSSQLPPFLHGCVLTLRKRTNAPGVDIEAVIGKAAGDLAPRLRAMPGFVLYGWIQTEGGRTAINIWQTAEQLRAGNAAVADWVAANTADTTVGEPEVQDGRIGYARLSGIT